MTRKKDTYPLRLRIDDDPRIEEFLNFQSGGYGDVLRYLIEKEIAQNGIRDLTVLIPSKRDINSMATTSIINNEIASTKVEPKENNRLMNLIREKTNEKILKHREETKKAEEDIEIITTDKLQVDNNIDENEQVINKENEVLPEGVLYKIVDNYIIQEEDQEEDDENIPSCYE